MCQLKNGLNDACECGVIVDWDRKEKIKGREIKKINKTPGKSLLRQLGRGPGDENEFTRATECMHVVETSNVEMNGSC